MMSRIRTESFSLEITGQYLWRTLVALSAFVLLLEGIARLPWPEAVLPPLSVESTGTGELLDIKLDRLETFSRENSGVDVIIFGSSLVHTGLDPLIMEETFRSATGRELRIFNFGIEGMSLPPTANIIQIISSQYPTALIIFGTEMRDYSPETGVDMVETVERDPWFRYQLGDFNLWGWIIEHSRAVQRYLSVQNWVRDDFPEWKMKLDKRMRDITSRGYEADNRVAEDLSEAPDPGDEKDQQMLEAYADYQIAPDRLADLKRILETDHTRVMILDMPVHPGVVNYFGDPREDFRLYRETLRETVKDYGGIFVVCDDLALPAEGYSNKFHLNKIGAPLFSRYMGEVLVDLYRSGKFELEG